MSTSILVADDSLTIQKVVELTFLEDDFEVTSVGSGEEAVQEIGKGLPDVVIADVHMPAPSGYQVCRRVKELDAGTPVILLVGTFEELDESEVAACGADSTLKKPFDSQELLRLVEGLLGGADTPAESTEPSPVQDFGALMSEPAIAPEPDPDESDSDGDGSGDAFEPMPLDEPAGASPGFELSERPVGDLSLGSAVTGVTEERVEEPTMDRTEMDEVEMDEPRMETPEPVQAASNDLSPEDVDRIARRVVELLGEDVVRELAWEVVPDLAEVAIRERIREIEKQVD